MSKYFKKVWPNHELLETVFNVYSSIYLTCKCTTFHDSFLLLCRASRGNFLNNETDGPSSVDILKTDEHCKKDSK